MSKWIKFELQRTEKPKREGIAYIPAQETILEKCYIF